MIKNRVMLLGAAGQVGQAIQYIASLKQLPATWELHLFSRADVNITNPAMLRDAIQQDRPDLVINVSGLTSVEEAEKNEPLAMSTNFHAVAQMAAQCSTLDIPLIHLSTDQVFDGRKTEPYTTEDQMNPINTYGGSKMMGEEALRQEHPFHVILRTSTIFSAFRRNILTRTLAMIEELPALRIVTDIVNAPTPALDLAKTIVSIGQQILAGKVDGYGTFHYCSNMQASRYDFVEEVIKAYTPFTARRPELVATVCAEFPDFIKRPAYAVLDCAKIKGTYGIEQPSWKEAIGESIAMLHRSGRLSKLQKKPGMTL